MPANRFQLRGPSMGAIREQAATLGTDVKIIVAEKVTVGGLGGIFGATHFEAIVEVTAPVPAGHAPVQMSRVPMSKVLTPERARTIGDLLAEADQAEAAIHSRPLPPVSTALPVFKELMQSLASQSPPEAPDAAQGPLVPVLASTPGDLVVIAGVGISAAEAAHSMAFHLGGATLAAGGTSTASELRVSSAAEATAARARGVLAGQPVLLAYGLGTCLETHLHLADLKSLGADQIWLVVDATRKHEDTEAWIGRAAAALDVTALAVIHTADTVSPRSAHRLDLPIGWMDSSPVRSDGTR